MTGTHRPEEFAGSSEYAEFSDLLARGVVDDGDADPARTAARRRRRRVGWVSALVVVLLLLGSVGGYVALALSAPLPAASVALEQPVVAVPPPAALILPETGAAAVSIVSAGDFAGDEALDGRIIAASGDSGPLPIASISKLITALVILDAEPLAAGEAGPTITFTKADDDLYDKYYLAGATVQSMKAGDRLTELDALKVVLVVSASNYAEATATWAFGSPAGFARAADAWLARNGLTGTRVVEPTGLDARNVSTTADLITIGKLAAAHPAIAAIVSAPTLDVAGFPPNRNNNDLLGVDGITGLKTGTLEAAGSCLLFSASVDVGGAEPVSVIGVVLGAADRAAVGSSVRALIASIRDGFHEVPLLAEGTVVGGYTTVWGDEARVLAVGDAALPTWSDTAIAVESVQTDPVTTAESGAEVGSVTFTAGDQQVTVGLALDGSITEPDGWWRLTHPQVVFAG